MSCTTSPETPLEIVERLNLIAGANADGDPQYLESGNGFLYSPLNSKFTGFYDGSASKPISTPSFRSTRKPVSAIMVQDASGGWWKLNGPEGTSKARLVSEAGSIYFEVDPANKPIFLDNEIVEATCEYEVAVWSKCDTNTSRKLQKIPLGKLLNPCGQGYEIALADYVTVCANGERQVIKPQKGYTLGGVVDLDGNVKWGLVKLSTLAVIGAASIFRYTGSVQTVVVPTGANLMSIKLWGACGGPNSYKPGGSNAGGGFTSCDFVVAEGDSYGIVVGGLGGFNGPAQNVLYPGAYGFGGGYGYHGISWFVPGGGGLTGVFTGTSEVAAGEMSRAIAIAGGGAGSSIFNQVSSANEGGNGTGTQVTMQGQTCPLTTFGSSGGGGYNGGNLTANGGGNGGGGTGFVHGDATNGVITKGGPNATANGSDDDYDEVNCNGLAVIRFSTTE